MTSQNKKVFQGTRHFQGALGISYAKLVGRVQRVKFALHPNVWKSQESDWYFSH